LWTVLCAAILKQHWDRNKIVFTCFHSTDPLKQQRGAPHPAQRGISLPHSGSIGVTYCNGRRIPCRHRSITESNQPPPWDPEGFWMHTLSRSARACRCAGRSGAGAVKPGPSTGGAHPHRWNLRSPSGPPGSLPGYPYNASPSDETLAIQSEMLPLPGMTKWLGTISCSG